MMLKSLPRTRAPAPSTLFPRIVVPLDGSHRAAAAARPAAELAARLGVPVTLFTLVGPDYPVPTIGADIDDLSRLLGDDVETDVVVRDAGARGRNAVTVAESILCESAADGALVCLASHGHGRIGATLLGSVTEELIARTTRPVLVVGPHFAEQWTLGDGRIVVGLDGSELAERAAGVGAEWSARLDNELWFVQVIEPTRSGTPRPTDSFETGYLVNMAKRHEGANFEVLHGRHPAAALAGLGDDWPDAMLVLATHGRGGWSRLVLGSVAMGVIHKARCPVLLVPRGEGGGS